MAVFEFILELGLMMEIFCCFLAPDEEFMS